MPFTEIVHTLPINWRRADGESACASRLEALDPVGDVVPKIERYVRIRAGTVKSRACSTVAEAVSGSFNYHKFLV